MRKVNFHLGTEFSCEHYEEIMEFEDGTTNEQISEYFEDWKNELLDSSWWDIEDFEKSDETENNDDSITEKSLNAGVPHCDPCEDCLSYGRQGCIHECPHGCY